MEQVKSAFRKLSVADQTAFISDLLGRIENDAGIKIRNGEKMNRLADILEDALEEMFNYGHLCGKVEKEK